MVAHHFSRVQVGETLSNLRNRSVGFLLDLKNDCLSRRLMSIVRLNDTVSVEWSGMVYVTSHNRRRKCIGENGERTEETQEIAYTKMQKSNLTHIKLSAISSTTPSPMPKTIAIWFFFSFASSAISPSSRFFVARTVRVGSMRWV